MAKKNGKNNLEKILINIKRKLNSINSIKETKTIVSLNAETLGLLKCSITLRKLDIRDFNNILFLKSEEKCERYLRFFRINKKTKIKKKNQPELKLNDFINQ